MAAVHGRRCRWWRTGLLWAALIMPVLPVEAAPTAAPAPPGDPVPTLASMADRNNDFGFDLYAILAKDGGNFSLSPYALNVGLGMAAAGARGATQAELRAALHQTGLSSDLVNAGYRVLVSAVSPAAYRQDKAVAAPATVELAAMLYCQPDMPVQVDYLKTVHASFGGDLRPVDFRDPEKAARIVNSWVSQHTHLAFKQAIAADDISERTRLMLVAALAFKTDWGTAFNGDETTPQPWHPARPKDTPAPPAQVPLSLPLMTQLAELPYADTDTAQLVELPYRQARYGLLVVLPHGGTREDLSALEAKMSSPRLTAWVDLLRIQKVRLYLPRLDLARTLKLAPALQGLGIKLAFDQQRADLTGMGLLKPGDTRYLERVLHGVTFVAAETGTLATATFAAPAGVYFGGVTAPPPPPPAPPPIPVVRADHPFVYLLLDHETGTILMMGRVLQPAFPHAGAPPAE